MLRIGLSVIFLTIAALMLVEAVQLGANTASGTVLLNLGTEIMGIIITIAFVDWIFERRRDQDNARKMAWRALHELDHAVWVWQGGRRDFAAEELLGLMALVGDKDPIPSFTGNLFLVLGSRSLNSLRHDQDILHLSPHLRAGLQALAPLAGIRDKAELMSPKVVVSHLKSAAGALFKAVGLEILPAIVPIDLYRDPSPQAQEWRHFGRIPMGLTNSSIPPSPSLPNAVD